jgi:hypothetical protein
LVAISLKPKIKTKLKIMQNLISTELYEVTEKLYRDMNPNGRMSEPPSSVYVTVIEKWYPEYQQSNSELSFYEWCKKNKSN